VHNNPIRYFDPWGLGQFAERPVDCFMCPPLDALGPPSDDPSNLRPTHEQFFFDNDDNVGFFPKGVGPDPVYPKNKDLYRRFGPPYDDELMRRIIDEDNPGNYCLVGNSCHDWADRIREEYERRTNTPPCFMGGRKGPHAC